MSAVWRQKAYLRRVQEDESVGLHFCGACDDVTEQRMVKKRPGFSQYRCSCGRHNTAHP